ncbi:MAG: hypothetical protein ACRDRO_21615 [Pseudonocardiaceae bacterium]
MDRDRNRELVASVDAAAATAGIAASLQTRHGLEPVAAMLAGHLITRHGWGEAAVLGLDHQARRARHRALPHHDHGHGW